MALVLLGCSTDDIFLLPNGVGEDGSLEVNLTVPQMESVRTRADQFAISTLRMLVFDGNDGKLLQLSDDIYPDLKTIGNASDHTYTLKVNLKAGVRDKSDLQFYFIANYADEIIEHLKENETVLDDLLNPAIDELTYNTPLASDQNIRMSGKADLRNMTSGDAVYLKRNAAKITVSDKSATADEPGSTYYPFRAYGMANEASIFAGAEEKCGDPTVADVSSEISVAAEGTTAGDNASYVHPTKKNIDSTVRPFIIVKAPYDGQQYYYRVDFRRAIKNAGKITEVEDLDVKPDHWYKFLVEDITGAGDTTEAEAAKHPSSLITVEILDVTPTSFNMVTDGSRELGVSHEVVYDGAEAGEKSLYIKMYSINNSDYPVASVDNFKDKIVNLSDEWMDVKSVDDVTNTSEGGNLGAGSGKVYKVTIEFKGTKSPGTLEGEISVDWKGLNRMVPVTWKRDFKGSDLCSVKLTIEGNTRTVNGSNVTYTDKTVLNKVDYWDFLEKVKGVSADANLGTARNEGLHFPLMYGYQGHEWEYKYEVTYNQLVEGNFEYKIYSTGSIINTNFKVTGGGITGGGSGTEVSGTANGQLVVEVTKPTNSWLYTYGEMVLSIKNVTSGKWDDFPLDLYHTGFFHNHGTDSSANWFYYEVLGDDDNNYWLDRNLGATAAGPCVVDSDGSINGTEDAIGNYDRPYSYNNTIDNQPTLKENVCPPGFMIPREETWNSIRNNNRFVKTITGGTYKAYLGSTVAGKRIYFPRSRYKDANNTLSGEPRAGYYWSSTPSVGFEKEELGNWMQAFVISGSITSYMPAELNRSNDGWAMNVRCVNRTSDSGNMYRTYFNVVGATHVFLYNNSNGQRTAATTWPGKAIGDYTTMQNGQSMSFVLDSPTTEPGDWYVIFNYKDENGKIHTYSKATDGSTRYTDNVAQKDLEGWKVVGDTNVTPNSKLGGTWTITYNAADAWSTGKLTFKEGNQIDDVKTYKYRIYWPYDAAKWNGVKIYNDNYSVAGGSYTGFSSGTIQNQTNGKYGKYSNSLAYLEFEVSRTQLSGTFTCQMIINNNQNSTTRTFTIPSSQNDGIYYSYTLDPAFGSTPGKNGKPDYFFINCYDLEGWGSMTLTVQNSSNGTLESPSAEKMHDYWPVRYRFKVSENDAIAKFKFSDGTNTVTANKGSHSISDIDNGYYTNGATTPELNKVNGTAISAPSSTSRRIALRAIDGVTWSKYYIHDWGGSNGSQSASDKEMKKIDSGGKVYYYYDIANNATGFLFTDGEYNDGNNKGHQTTDISSSIGTYWKAGQLVQQWYTPGFSVKN